MTHTEHVQITEHAALAYDIPDGMTLCPGCAGTGCANCQSTGLIAAIRHDAAAEYDRHLLDTARALCALSTPTDMREYLVNVAGTPAATVAIHDSSTVAYHILGRLQATAAELVRWLDRIPEANRG